MSWEWSHTADAYQNVRDNIFNLNIEALKECFAEIKSIDTEDNYFDQEEYDFGLKHAELLSKDELAEFIWNFASEYRTCDNGGFNAYITPDGCRTVSFDNEKGE